MNSHYSVVIVGGGQAGLSMSYCLKERGLDHIVFEKTRLGIHGDQNVGIPFVWWHPIRNVSFLGIPIQGTICMGFWKRMKSSNTLRSTLHHLTSYQGRCWSVESSEERFSGGFWINNFDWEHRGVTEVQFLYFLGLPWLYTWGSGRFSGIARDATYLADYITARKKVSYSGAWSIVNEYLLGS